MYVRYQDNNGNIVIEEFDKNFKYPEGAVFLAKIYIK